MKGFKPVIAGVGAVIVAAIIIVLLQQHRPTVKELPVTVFQPRINQFIYDRRDFMVGETIAEIERNLGAPLRIEREKVKNIHNPEQTDEVYELIYDGLSITVYKVTESQREIITDIAVTSDKYPMKWGLHVGIPIHTVTQNLGKPSKQGDNVYIYGTDEAPSYVSFYHKEGIVYKIAWEFYID